MKTKLNTKVLLYVFLIAAGLGLVLGVTGLIPFLNILTGLVTCCLIWFVGAAFAVYAARAHGITKDEVMDGLIVGALAGFISGLGYAIVAELINLLGTALGLGAASMFSALEDYGFSTVDVTAMAGFSIGTMIVSLIFSVVVFTVSGAIGGIIYAAVTEGKITPAKTE
jgi:hypothetical protein